MRFSRIFLLFVLMTAGCATHYYRSEPDAVVFYLKAPKVERVQIAASYNRYAIQSAERINGSTWAVRMPGDLSFSYFYLVDGKSYTPPCEMMEQDDFGQANCIFSPTP